MAEEPNIDAPAPRRRRILASNQPYIVDLGSHFSSLALETREFRFTQFMKIINALMEVNGDYYDVMGWMMPANVMTIYNAFLDRIRNPLGQDANELVQLRIAVQNTIQGAQVGPPFMVNAQNEPGLNVPAVRLVYTGQPNRQHVQVVITNIGLDEYRLLLFNANMTALQQNNLFVLATFNVTLGQLVEQLRIAVGGIDDPYYSFAERVGRYANDPMISIMFWMNNIMFHRPARYFLEGFTIVARLLLQNLPHSQANPAPATFVLTANLLQQLHTGATINPLVPHVFGPGALGWLICGLWDRCLLALARRTDVYIAPIRDVVHAPAFLRFNVLRNNGTNFVFQIPLDPTLSPAYANPAQMPAALNMVTTIFNNAYLAFNDPTHSFYGNRPAPAPITGITSITIAIGGVYRRMIRGGQIVDGNNVFFERVLDVPGGRLAGKKSHFVLFRSFDTLNQVYLHGCVSRALACTCKPNSDDKPVFCSCPLPDHCEGVPLEDVPALCKGNGDKYLVFVINISRNDENGQNTKSITLYHKGENYFTDGGKVMYIVSPEWEKVQGHCALWLPYERDLTCRNEGYSRFLGYAAFNKVNHLLGLSQGVNFCPVCGETYADINSWAHYLKHSDKLVCKSCGLEYEEQEDYESHVKYHCKQLPAYSAIILKDEEIQYEEKSATGEWIVVYADLESAITGLDAEGERMHINILVGWADEYNKEVRIAKRIGDFLNDLVKLPTTDVLIYFHNGEGYDFHFILRDLCDCRKGFVKNFSLVGDSGQKVRYFSVDYRGKHLHFRDSFAFVSESLENWVESSKKSGCPFELFNSTFDEYKRGILLRKNPFPYNAVMSSLDLDKSVDWLWTWAEVDNSEELFCYKYNKDELHEFAEWLKANYKECKWKTVRDYYVDYLKCDVSQLYDIMRFFAKNVQEEFHLNIHEYYGTPSLTWAAWLKQNKFPLEPITVSKHYDIINSSIRGGQTGVMTRYYNSEVEGGAMFDLDINSLYATVMLKFPYPCHDWKEEEIPEINGLIEYLDEMHENGRSAFFEVDIEVVENERYANYIPIASKRKVKGVYDYAAMRFYDTEDPQLMLFQGLTQVQGMHEHYCCHSRNLRWYLVHRVIKLHKIWQVLSGKDEYVFRDYVQHNLDERAKNDRDPIKKMLYKLLNNALYGKTYEDETQRADFRLEPQEKVDEDDMMVVRRVVNKMGEWILYEADKKVFKVNKPVFLGACITEFSKLWMYIMYYDKIRPKFPDCEVYYTDTDAITVLFPTKVSSMADLAKILNSPEEQIIDTSNFDVLPEEPWSKEHNCQPGLFKSETGSKRILKFIGLRAKTYIMVCEDDFIKMSVKGCPKAEKAKLTFEDFESVLFSSGKGKEISYDAIRSRFHMVKSVQLTRIVLSADDRKRYIHDDLVHTSPLFSKAHLDAITCKNPHHQ